MPGAHLWPVLFSLLPHSGGGEGESAKERHVNPDRGYSQGTVDTSTFPGLTCFLRSALHLLQENKEVEERELIGMIERC